MFSKWSSLAVAVLSAVTVVQAASGPASLAKCGDDPAVLSTTSFTHKGSEVSIKTIACPGVTKPGKRSVPNKRQTFDQCGFACELECVEFTNPTPSELDCLELGEALAESTSFFVAPSGSITTATLGNCESSWINDSIFEYEYCLSDWGGIVFDLAEDCIPTFSGGACIQTTQDWLIEVFG